MQAFVVPTVWMHEEATRIADPKKGGTFQPDRFGGGRSMLFSFLRTDYLVTSVGIQKLFQDV